MFGSNSEKNSIFVYQDPFVKVYLKAFMIRNGVDSK